MNSQNDTRNDSATLAMCPWCGVYHPSDKYHRCASDSQLSVLKAILARLDTIIHLLEVQAENR